MKGQMKKRIIVLMVGLVIIASAIPSLMAKPSCDAKMGAPIAEERDLCSPYLYFPSILKLIIADMAIAQQISGSDAEKTIRVSAEIVILRPSGRD